MSAKHAFLFRTGTLALAFCAVLIAAPNRRFTSAHHSYRNTSAVYSDEELQARIRRMQGEITKLQRALDTRTAARPEEATAREAIAAPRH